MQGLRAAAADVERSGGPSTSTAPPPPPPPPSPPAPPQAINILVVQARKVAPAGPEEQGPVGDGLPPSGGGDGDDGDQDASSDFHSIADTVSDVGAVTP